MAEEDEDLGDLRDVVADTMATLAGAGLPSATTRRWLVATTRIALDVAEMSWLDVVHDDRWCVFCGRGGGEPNRWTDQRDIDDGLIVREDDKPNREFVEDHAWWHRRGECSWLLARDLIRDMGGPETVRAQLDGGG